MTPALVMLVWFAVMGENQPLPPLLLLGLFILCPMAYWWLIQKGRLEKDGSQPSSLAPHSSPSDLPTVIDTTLLSKESATTPPIRPISGEEEKSLRDCFPWGVYYLQKLDYFPQAILCRGKLRASPDVA